MKRRAKPPTIPAKGRQWRSSWRDLIPLVESIIAPEVRFALVETATPAGVGFDKWPPPEIEKWLGWHVVNFRGGLDGKAIWCLNQTGEGFLIPFGGVSPMEQALDVFCRLGLRRFPDVPDTGTALARWLAHLFDAAEVLAVPVESFAVDCAKTGGGTEVVSGRMIVDTASACGAAVAKLSEEDAPPSIRKPHYTEAVRRVWDYLDRHKVKRTLDVMAEDLTMGKSTLHAALKTLRVDGIVKDRKDGTREVAPFE